jgi:hypothetical protein
MPSEQDSKDEGTGFETSAELRHGETFPDHYEVPPAREAERPRRVWIARTVVLAVAIAVVGVVIYILVSVV